MAITLKPESEQETYEYILEEEKSQPDASIFILRDMTTRVANAIDDEITFSDRKGRTQFLVGTSRFKKLEYCLVNWKNVKDAKGNDISCTRENKLLLPSRVQNELVEEINRRAGITVEEEKN